MERRVSTRRNRADAITDFFNSLLGVIYLPPNRPLLGTRT